MNIIETLNIVMKNMIEKKSRVFLTLLGIIIGIFTFTFFIFVSQGLSNAISDQFNSLGTNILGVQRVENANSGPSGAGITDKQVSEVKQVVREYKYIAPGIFATLGWNLGREKEFNLALAYPDKYLNQITLDLGLEMESGRVLRPNDKGSIIVGNKVSTDKFKKDIKVGNSLKVGDYSFRVIGIIKKQGDLFIDNSIIMNFDDIKKASGQDTYSVIRIKFIEGADLDYYQKQIEDKLNPNKNQKEFTVTSAKQAIEKFNQILGLLSAIIGFISSIALLVGGINVMNTMYSNVIERTNEISVYKAIGATNSDIRNLFLIESSILGIIGALIGFFLSFGLAKIVSIIIANFDYNVPIYFDITFFLEVIIITSIFTMIFGTYPAIKAAKVNPADNLRDE